MQKNAVEAEAFLFQTKIRLLESRGDGALRNGANKRYWSYVSKVWLKIASLFDEVLVRFGGVPVQVGLSCLHEQENYRLKLIELGDEPKVRRRKQRYIKRKLAQMAETSKQPEVKKERESH